MGVKISELTSAGTLAGTEKIPCVNSGTQHTTPADIKTYIKPTYITAQATPVRVTAAAPDALGEYRSYLRDAGARTYSETNGSPTTAPSSSNGYKLYNGNAFASADTNNEPTRYEIFIGTGKTPQFEFYTSTGRTGFICVDLNPNSGTGDSGCAYGYDPTTGVAFVTVAHLTSAGCAPGLDADTNRITTDVYFDIKC